MMKREERNKREKVSEIFSNTSNNNSSSGHNNANSNAQSPDNNNNNSNDEDDIVYEDSPPLFYTYFPITRVIIHNGCLSVGGTHLPTFFSFYFLRCICLTTIKNPPKHIEPIASYRTVIRIEFHHTECNFFKNPAFRLDESKIKPLDMHLEIRRDETLEYCDRFFRNKSKEEEHFESKKKNANGNGTTNNMYGNENNKSTNSRRKYIYLYINYNHLYRKANKNTDDPKNNTTEPPFLQSSLITVFYFWDTARTKKDSKYPILDSSAFLQQGVQVTIGCLYHRQHPVLII